MSEQIHPWDTLAHCLCKEQPTKNIMSHLWLKKTGTPVVPCQTPSVVESVLGLAGQVSVCCDWQRQQVWLGYFCLSVCQCAMIERDSKFGWLLPSQCVSVCCDWERQQVWLATSVSVCVSVLWLRETASLVGYFCLSVSVCCDWERQQVWLATSISACQFAVIERDSKFGWLHLSQCVSMLWLWEIESLVGSFYLSMSVCCDLER